MAFNPFQGAGESVARGLSAGADYAKTAMDIDLKRQLHQQKMAEFQQTEKQRNFEFGKWFMDETGKIAKAQGGKYKNALIKSMNQGLATMGYGENESLNALLTDEAYANEIGQAIATYHQMTPEQQQEWLPKMTEFIQSGDPAEMLKVFNNQSFEMKKMADEQKGRIDLEKTKAGIKATQDAAEKPGKDLNTAMDLHKHLSGLSSFKEYQQIRQGFRDIEAATKNGSAYRDLNTIYAFMKAMDPNSIVRESEGQLLIDTGSATQGIANMLQKTWTGEKMQPEQRKEVFSIVAGKLNNFVNQYEKASAPLLNVAEKTGVDRTAADPGAGWIAEDRKLLSQYQKDKKGNFQSTTPEDVTKEKEEARTGLTTAMSKKFGVAPDVLVTIAEQRRRGISDDEINQSNAAVKRAPIPAGFTKAMSERLLPPPRPIPPQVRSLVEALKQKGVTKRVDIEKKMGRKLPDWAADELGIK